MYSKDKLSIPIYFPQFLLDWLNLINAISKNDYKGLFIEFYFKHILIYFII